MTHEDMLKIYNAIHIQAPIDHKYPGPANRSAINRTLRYSYSDLKAELHQNTRFTPGTIARLDPIELINWHMLQWLSFCVALHLSRLDAGEFYQMFNHEYHTPYANVGLSNKWYAKYGENYFKLINTLDA